MATTKHHPLFDVSVWHNLPSIPRLPTIPLNDPLTSLPSASVLTSSSVSSPSAPDLNTNNKDVDDLLEGLDRVRIDDLWNNHHHHHHHHHHHQSHPHPLHKPFSVPCPSPTPIFAPPEAAHALGSLLNEDSRVGGVDGIRIEVDFPRLFKVYKCNNPDECVRKGEHLECFGYHAPNMDRRRLNTALYKPHMCRFIEEVAGCRKGDRCPFAHNDFERRYHPDRFGKETCRDFLRGDCPRRFCTFRHQVSSKVEISLAQIDHMNDKELLQMVLKIDEAKGRALCEKLLRRFGHGKKHSGWKLQGFDPRGRDDQKVKYILARVELVKRKLKLASEKKWAATLKTSSLRDMMSGVRKVAEEIRERCRSDENYVEQGSEVHRLIRSVFSNTNWSCHSQEGDNPFLVTPENQNDAMTALEKLVDVMLTKANNQDNVIITSNTTTPPSSTANVDKKKFVGVIGDASATATTYRPTHTTNGKHGLWAYPLNVSN